MNTILADDISEILQYNEESVGCKAVLIKKEKSSCTTKRPTKISIAPIIIPDKKNIKINKLEEQLTGIKEEFLNYKDGKDDEIKKIFTQLNALKKEFNQYKGNKDKKIKRIKTQLVTVKSQLHKNKKRLAMLNKNAKKKKKIIKRKKRIKQKSIRKKTTTLKKEKIIEKKPEIITLPEVNYLPWIDIVVEDNIDIYQLALKYYKDKREYKQIYSANRDIIEKNLKLNNGMILKIPMTEKFEEQPMFLNPSNLY